MRSACSRPYASGCGVKRSGSKVPTGIAILMPMSLRTLLRSVPHTISNSTSPWTWIRSLPSSKERCIPPWIIAIIHCHTTPRYLYDPPARNGFVANFAQEVMKGQWPLSVGGLGGQRIELFGRSAALVSLLDHQLSFLDHVHQFDANESGLRRVKRFEP